MERRRGERIYLLLLSENGLYIDGLIVPKAESSPRVMCPFNEHVRV